MSSKFSFMSLVTVVTALSTAVSTSSVVAILPSLRLATSSIVSSTDAGKIQELLAAIEELVTQLAVAQSGGIGFGNFDIDLGAAISRLGIECSDSNRAVLADAVRVFVKWVNVTHTRFCREPYYITLNIGLGTFRPVKVQDTKDHVMHSELYEISEEAAERLNKAKAEGRRIIAIGTTSVRTLESCFQKYGTFKATREATAIFINPGYEYKAVDALITNFHLPKSTLVMLVSAFMGRKWTLHCYEEAVKEKYRFFSFGDGMFIYGKYDYSHNAED